MDKFDKWTGIFIVIMGLFIMALNLFSYTNSESVTSLVASLGGITFVALGINIGFIMPKNKDIGKKITIVSVAWAVAIFVLMLVVTYGG